MAKKSPKSNKGPNPEPSSFIPSSGIIDSGVAGILDGIYAGVYISRLDSFEILYANGYMRELFGDVVGRTCWQVFMGRKSPCDFCNTIQLKTMDGKPLVWDVQSPVNGRWYEFRERAVTLTPEVARPLRQEVARPLRQEVAPPQRQEVALSLTQGVASTWSDEVQLRLSVFSDITDRVEAQMAVQARIKFETLITSISTKFINLSNVEIDEAVERALADIGTYLGADNAALALFNEDGSVESVYGWHCEGDECSFKVQSGIDYRKLKELVAGDGSVCVADVDDLPTALRGMKKRLKTALVKSLMALPVVYGGETIGILAFDATAQNRPWNGDTSLLVTVVCEIFANALERKKAAHKLEHMAHYDPLTNIPNRMLFSDRFKRALSQAKRNDTKLALIFLDLDGFKYINDTLGHDVGDLLLKETARRLEACTRESDTVARMGGDEFTVVLTNLEEAKYAAGVAAKIIKTLSKPFVLKGYECSIGASVGISLYPLNGEDSETLLKRADVAMYQAKVQGKNNYQFYTADLNVTIIEKMKLESNLRNAVRLGELVMEYQPQVDIVTGRFLGAEALMRWNHPELGRMAPDRFIPIAEESGLIIPIFEWALYTSCTQNKRWQSGGYSPLYLCVNLSSRQFKQKNLVEMVKKTLDITGLSPNFLNLELSESYLIHNSNSTIRMLNELKALGVFITIDDFGTGYLSLKHLKNLPIDILKIDRSFVQDGTYDPMDASIARAIIAMAHSLNMRVIAEGVETNEQLEYLRTLGCDGVQGFLFTPPVPVPEFTELLAEDTLEGKLGAERGVGRGIA